MARTTNQARKRGSDLPVVSVEAFRDIHIHFPGDVYLLAVWIAMSDLAKSTPTQRPQTTLYGLAARLASLASDISKPLTAEMVMAHFREHGLRGNPVLRLTDEFAADGSPLFTRERPRRIAGPSGGNNPM